MNASMNKSTLVPRKRLTRAHRHRPAVVIGRSHKRRNVHKQTPLYYFHHRHYYYCYYFYAQVERPGPNVRATRQQDIAVVVVAAAVVVTHRTGSPSKRQRRRSLVWGDTRTDRPTDIRRRSFLPVFLCSFAPLLLSSTCYVVVIYLFSCVCRVFVAVVVVVDIIFVGSFIFLFYRRKPLITRRESPLSTCRDFESVSTV